MRLFVLSIGSTGVFSSRDECAEGEHFSVGNGPLRHFRVIREATREEYLADGGYGPACPGSHYYLAERITA